MRAALVIALGALALLPGCSWSEPEDSSDERPSRSHSPPTRAEHATRPNVVVFMTDDQNQTDVEAMPHVRRLLADEGVSFPESFVNFPLCCPSRATFLTGQYAHNHGVLSNGAPDGGYRVLDSANTLPVWLADEGYRTAYIGKYLNGVKYHQPPGWQHWIGKGGSTDNKYFDYYLNQNGRLVRYGSEPRDHIDSVITRKAVRYVEQGERDGRPFFLTLGFQAPHVRDGPYQRRCGPEPAPRDVGAFADEPFPRSPSFNEGNVSDKPGQVANNRPLSEESRKRIITRYRCRLESLLGVDRGVAQVVGALERAGSLEETYLIFTSDNGFLQGEHRIRGGKKEPYEESIRVPLIIRGPGIPHGEESEAMAVNADLAPTIAALTGARPQLRMDGESLLSFARDPSRTNPRSLLIQADRFTGLRTQRYAFVERDTGEHEFYDLREDPYELLNVAGDEAYAGVQAELVARLAELRQCAGASCRR